MKYFFNLLFLTISLQIFAQQRDSADFYFGKGMESKKARIYLVASQAFEKAVGFDKRFAAAYFENALVLMEMKKNEAAIRNFTKAHEINPADKATIRQLMDLHYNYRQFTKAIEFANKCTDCPNSSRIIGMGFYRQEDYLKAEKYLMTAISKDPSDAEATYTLARSYVDMDLYTKAIPYYEKAVQLDKSKPLWQYELGLIHFNLTNYKASVASLNNALANGYKPGDDFNENLGYSSLYSGQYEKGEKLLMGIWMKKPGNTDLLRDMAEVLYQQKQYDRSLTYCQKLMEINMDDSRALYQAGLNFIKKGNKDKGQQMCDRAININPSLASLRREMKMPGM
jgi:tetratricopeptide (TPR) repeat protein